MVPNPKDSPSARDWAVEAVQWGPARNTLKRGAHQFARARSWQLRKSGSLPEVANIFAASSPKSGSQWAKALFDHHIIRAHTGLFTLPQLNYQDRQKPPHFPLGTFVPGLYLSYPEYQQISKPPSYRTFYVFRDPRSVVVSAYFSALGPHRKIPALEYQRAAMQEMSVDIALSYAIELMAGRLREMESWFGVEDENVAAFYLERIGSDPGTEIAEILDHCRVSLTEAEFETVLRDTSRESLQKKDLAQRQAGAESHYRVHPKGFRELFKGQHYEAIEAVVPGLVERLGYPS